MFLVLEAAYERDCLMDATLFAIGYRCYNTMLDYQILSERSSTSAASMMAQTAQL